MWLMLQGTDSAYPWERDFSCSLLVSKCGPKAKVYRELGYPNLLSLKPKEGFAIEVEDLALT